jgi:dTDP-4-dehydrorhamnose 3,5-epimerase
MKIKQRNISGVYEISLDPIGDNRGFFMRTFDMNEFNKHDLNKLWVQENHARSTQQGIIRGLHFQFPPYAENKLVRCVRGKVLDVIVDLRKDSPSFGQWDSIELSKDNKNMLFFPRGFAHGYCTLAEECEVIYKVDNFYVPDHEGRIMWNDPYIGIDWPVSNPILSEKDKNNMTFKEFIAKYKYIEH